MGGGFPPPPPSRPPPVLLPLLRLACAGDPGAPRPGPRRPARRYSASDPQACPHFCLSFSVPIPEFTCLSLLSLSPFFSQSTPTHLLERAQTRSIQRIDQGSHAPSLSLSFPFCKDPLRIWLIFAQSLAWHLSDPDPTSI